MVLFSSAITFAQTDILRQKLDSMFQNVNKTAIPTGYLKEYGLSLCLFTALMGIN